MSNSKDLPNFVTAGSHQGLRQQMFAVNARHGSFHKFFDIQQFQERGKTKWIAWYYMRIDSLKGVDEGEE